MGQIQLPKKQQLLDEINKIVVTVKGKTTITGYWLNYFLRSIIYLADKALVNAGGVWIARISQSGVNAPELSVDSMGGAGHVIMNTIEYNGALVNISFEWLAPGTYKCIADQPIFAEFNNFSVVWANNFVLDVGGIAQYGEIYITHDPASPTEFIFYTFDGINGGLPQDNFLLNCTLEINREC